jgi:hypothetical protein
MRKLIESTLVSLDGVIEALPRIGVEAVMTDTGSAYRMKRSALPLVCGRWGTRNPLGSYS